MSRTIVDSDLNRWEVFASAGPSGYADPAALVFRCLTDRDRPSRGMTVEGDKSEAEAAVLRSSETELQALLERATPLS
jgi:hypothetical protein